MRTDFTAEPSKNLDVLYKTFSKPAEKARELEAEKAAADARADAASREVLA